jgi:hypothetical protein
VCVKYSEVGEYVVISTNFQYPGILLPRLICHLHYLRSNRNIATLPPHRNKMLDSDADESDEEEVLDTPVNKQYNFPKRRKAILGRKFKKGSIQRDRKRSPGGATISLFDDNDDASNVEGITGKTPTRLPLKRVSPNTAQLPTPKRVFVPYKRASPLVVMYLKPWQERLLKKLGSSWGWLLWDI